MRTLKFSCLSLALALGFILSASAKQLPVLPATPTGVAWDMDDVQLTSIIGFNFCVDATCSPIALTSKTASLNGVSTFQVPFPSLTSGKHNLTVAACDSTICSPPITLPVNVPVAPKGLKVIR